jgi:ornithine carbamoyltransferase
MKTRAPERTTTTNGKIGTKEGIEKLSAPFSLPAVVAMKPQKVPAPQKKFCDDLLSINDLGPVGVRHILSLTARVKANPAAYKAALAGKQLALFFEKPSLRTRLTFEAGINSMGGASFFFDQTHARLDAREKLSDIAHNLERWIDGVILRTFDHATVAGMAEHADIPVVNGLSDLEHPCQALADYFTLTEKFPDVKKTRLAYVGDGNNVANSLMLAAACLGSEIVVATPAGYEPSADVLASARATAKRTGASIEVTNDPVAAVSGADAVYTDVWASMGEENEAAERKRIFAAYQVNESLMSHAADGAVFMHCLPAHRGDEVTDAVIDSAQSVVFDQAENRLHVQKAILLMLLGNNDSNLANDPLDGKRSKTLRGINV